MDDLDVAAARNGEGYYRNKLACRQGEIFSAIRITGMQLWCWQNETSQSLHLCAQGARADHAHLNQPLARTAGANFVSSLYTEAIGWFTDTMPAEDSRSL